MNTHYTIKIDFLHPTTLKPYTSIERIIVDDLPEEEFLSLRYKYVDQLIDLFTEYEAQYIVHQNDGKRFYVQCLVHDRFRYRLEAVVEMMHATINPVPYTDAEIIYFQDNGETNLEDKLIETITKRVDLQDNRYVHVFRNTTLSNTHVLFVYTNIVAPIDIDNLGVYRTKSYLIPGNKQLKTSEIWLGTTVTEYHVSDTLNEKATAALYANMTEWLEKLRTLTEIKSMTQGLDDTDNPDLNQDLLLLPNTIYRFDKDNEHDIRVLEHSVIHYKQPYIVLTDMKRNQAYACIIHDYTLDLLDKQIPYLRSFNLSTELIHVRDIEGVEYGGLGWYYLENEPLAPSKLNDLLSLMKFGEPL